MVSHKQKHNLTQQSSITATICLKMITGSGECAQLIIFIKLALVYTGQMMVGLACWLVGLAFHS
jgi:hypothetical protein